VIVSEDRITRFDSPAVATYPGRSHLSPDGGGLKWHVATCRQTVEAFLAPPSTAWQRMATGNDPKEKGLLLQTPLSRYPPKPNTIPITSVLATRATRKTTRFSVRDAKYNAAGAMHRVAWALQDSKAIGQISGLQSNWPDMRKTLGKPLVLQRRGQEPNFWVFSLRF